MSLTVESIRDPSRVFVVVSNDTNSPLWFPVESAPVYKPDRQHRRLQIWFGYFNGVYGAHKGDYVVPRFQVVSPGSKYKFEITSPELINAIRDLHGNVNLSARIASKFIRSSDLRNEHPLNEYVKYSFVVNITTVIETQ
jgi:hypothetical protein